MYAIMRVGWAAAAIWCTIKLCYYVTMAARKLAVNWIQLCYNLRTATCAFFTSLARLKFPYENCLVEISRESYDNLVYERCPSSHLALTSIMQHIRGYFCSFYENEIMRVQLTVEYYLFHMCNVKSEILSLRSLLVAEESMISRDVFGTGWQQEGHLASKFPHQLPLVECTFPPLFFLHCCPFLCLASGMMLIGLYRERERERERESGRTG